MRERSLREHRRLVPLRLQERIRHVSQTEPLRGCLGQSALDWDPVDQCADWLRLFNSPD